MEVVLFGHPTRAREAIHPILSKGVIDALSNPKGLEKLEGVDVWRESPKLLDAVLVEGKIKRTIGGLVATHQVYDRDEMDLEVVFVPLWMALNVPDVLQGELTGCTLACVTREELERIVVRNQELGLLM